MATEADLPPATRRRWLECMGLGAMAVCLPAGAGGVPRPTAVALLAACWDDTEGRHQAGWLQVDPSPSGAAVRVQHATEVPTRGHGLALLPDGDVLVVARRPGDWLVRLSPSQRPHWVWMEAGRQFNGHVLSGSAGAGRTFGSEGCTVFTTETDTGTGHGLLGVRDVHSLEKCAEFPTHGMDPHAVLAMPAHGPGGAGQGGAHPLVGMLFVANGGIDTATETGRTPRHLDRMDPSVVCLHPTTGELLGQWRLPDPQLSIRHLAWAHTPAGLPVLGIALQAHHPDGATRAAAPVLAVLDWQHNPQGELRLATGQPALAGYGGDVAVVGQGVPPHDALRASPRQAPHEAPHFVISATRGHALARYALDGSYLGHITWVDAGGLSTGQTVWAAGRLGALRAGPTAAVGDTGAGFGHGRLDNHWLSVPVT